MLDAIALVLPGMSLNATVFPDLGLPTLAIDFNQFVPAVPGMHPYVERVNALVADSAWEKAPRRVVVAHSFGGMLALSWLLARPDAPIDGAVLIATTAGPMFRAVRLRVAWWRHHALRVGVGAVFPFWDAPLVTRGLHRVLNRGRPARSPVDFRALPYTDDIRVGLAGWQATDWRARRAFRHAMDGYDVRMRLAEVTVPTIVLHGDRDCYFAPAGARLLAAALPRGELRIIEGAGHVLPLTHGESVIGAVRDLLTRAQGA